MRNGSGNSSRGGEFIRVLVSVRSCHAGFVASIRVIFFSLRQLFSCFSRWIVSFVMVKTKSKKSFERFLTTQIATRQPEERMEMRRPACGRGDRLVPMGCKRPGCVLSSSKPTATSQTGFRGNRNFLESHVTNPTLINPGWGTLAVCGDHAGWEGFCGRDRFVVPDELATVRWP